MKQFPDYKVVIWWFTYGKHTHSWIHFGFFRAFEHLGYDVVWLENKIENLPPKSQKTIIISAQPEDQMILENLSDNWIFFDHNYGLSVMKNIIPFWVQAWSFASYPPVSTTEYRHYLEIPKIFWWTDLLPHEIEFVPYHYSNSRDIRFIGSWWFDNWKALERARIWCFQHGKSWEQLGKHIFLRYKKFVPEDVIGTLSREAFLTLSIQGEPQCETGYIPCRLFKNISYSVLALSNNLFVANMFDEDEVVIDRDIPTLLDKGAKIVYDRKVDDYTRKALEKVKKEHTYINRIEQLFSYMK